MAKKKKADKSRSQRAHAQRKSADSPRLTGRKKKQPPRRSGRSARSPSREVPRPTGLEALLPDTNAQPLPSWIRDLRPGWRAASSEQRRKSHRELARASQQGEPEQRLDALQRSLTAIGMKPSKAARLIIHLYYERLVPGRADVIGKVAALLMQTLTDFEANEN
jgi:hypothetical protein